MTFAEWPIFLCDEPTKLITLPLLPLAVFTVLTPNHAVISAQGMFHQPWHLPAASEAYSPTCLGAGGCCEIIIGVAIEVATETTSLTSVSAGQSDHKIMFPVVTDSQTEISLNDHRAATLKHNQFVV